MQDIDCSIATKPVQSLFIPIRLRRGSVHFLDKSAGCRVTVEGLMASNRKKEGFREQVFEKTGLILLLPRYWSAGCSIRVLFPAFFQSTKFFTLCSFCDFVVKKKS
jgi:hypothetical protein